MVELANLIASRVQRPITWMHMPVPIDRVDDAFFAPLAELSCIPRRSCTWAWFTRRTAWRARRGGSRPRAECAELRHRLRVRHLPRPRTPRSRLEFIKTYAGAAAALEGME